MTTSVGTVWNRFRPGPGRRGHAGGFVRAVLWLGLCLPEAAPAGWSSAEPLRHAEYDFWQTSDGLPRHDVVSVAQTTDGYIWAGTTASSNTLARFNGKEFALVPSPPGVRDERWARLAAGKGGRLWVSKSGAGTLVLWEHGKAKPMRFTLPKASDWGIPLYEDRNENLWIGGEGLLMRTPDGRIKDYCSITNEFGSIRGIAQDRRGTVWLAASDGLARYREGRFDRPYPITNNFFTVYPARDGSLWLGAESKIGAMQVTPSGEVIPFSAAQGLTSEGVGAICEDLEGNLWLGTHTGLCYVKAGRVYPVQENDLRTAFIFSLLRDQEGSLWAGTADGLYRARNIPFENYGPAEGLGPVNTLYSGLSGLWASVYVRGVFLYRDNGWEHVGFTGNPGVENLVEFPAGELWVVIDHRCYRFRQGKTEVAEGIEGDIRFCTDGRGVWIVTGTGLFFSSEGGAAKKAEWPFMQVTSLATNLGGGLLIGTTDGVSRWAGSGELTSWLRFAADFPGTRANSLEWEGQSLWLASDVALGRCQAGRWQVIRPEAGLAETGGINNFLAERENLWLGCNNGLFRIRRAEAEDCLRGVASRVTAVQYDRTRGVRPGYFGPGPWGQGTARSRDGRLWFASRIGVVAVNTAIALNERPPPVVIESLKLNQQPVSFLAQGDGPALRIPPGTRSVEIGYAALTYIAPDRVRYKYRLQGLDSDWVQVGNTRAARFARLAPGAYEFQVAACNSDGIWNDTGARIRLVQEPFFHQTRTFMVLCWVAAGAVFAGLATGVARVAHAVSMRRMRRRLALLEAQRALDQERTRIARDIHDDLGSTLTRIVLLTELGRREPAQTHTPDGHLAAIQTAARDITRRLDEIVWAINPGNDTLDALVTYISKMAADQARAAGLRCRLDLPSVLPTWPLTGSVRHNLFLASKEALHNAIKHADPDELRLRLVQREDSFDLEISDDGVGLPAAPETMGGDGLVNLRERLAALGGECLIRSAPGQGTVVRRRK